MNCQKTTEPMRDQQPSAPVFVSLVHGMAFLLLCFGIVACGNGSDRSADNTASSTSGDVQMPDEVQAPDDVQTSVESDSAPTDTEREETEGPTPIESDDDMEFEEVSPSSEEESVEGDGSDAGDESSPDPADPDSSAPPEPDPVRSTLEVITDPGQATVTIRNQETGTTRTEETPATFEVPPGLYSWTVEKDGYAPKESRQAINLKTQREQTERIALASVSGGGAYLERGNRAYEEGDYQQAIRLYEQVANPGPNEKPDDYLRAQAQLGRIYWQQQENYESAIQAYQNIIDYDDTRYEAFLNLARINYETESYEEVLDHLDRVDELKYRIPAQNQKRQRISLRVRSLRGRTLFRQAQDERTRNRRAKALRANQEFQGFLDSVPAELESTFQQEISEIQRMEEEVRTLLREEIR